MTSTGLTDLEGRRARLRRISVVFAVELRLKIVTELYAREMSPTQFYNEFGGGSISRVTRNFERLDESGWLEYVRSEGPGGSRRGGVERFYRATELAFFDAETWALLPYSIRVAFSWNSFKQIASRLRDAIETGKVTASASLGLTHKSACLDQEGWDNAIEMIRTHFEFLSEEQRESSLRLARASESPLRVSVIQIAFEPPSEVAGAIAPSIVESLEEPFVPLPVRLSKVFADDVAMGIVAEANRREISAKQFHAEIGGDTAAGIRRRFTKLAGNALLTEVEAKTGGRRRGAREKFYRATGPAIFDSRSGPWVDTPRSLEEADIWRQFEGLSVEVKDAMKAGTFDARDDSCLAWSLLSLDAHGWRAVMESLDELRLFIDAEQDRASSRMTQSGEKPVTMTVALAAFESPRETEREP
jgi:hypothetical protein